MLCKACPKCGGDLMVERGFAGEPPDIICLQCGRRLNAEERAAAFQGPGIKGYGRDARTTQQRPTAA